MRKISVSFLVASTLLAISVGTVFAIQGGLRSFGIRPTEAMENRLETFSYFSHVAEPGTVIHEEALVFNDGNEPIDLTLYAADGMTAQNGGTSFATKGNFSLGGSREVSNWLTVSVSDIHLEAGEELIVPFTITVPPGAAPGHHIAGLVVEAPPESGQGSANEEEQTQFAVQIVRRVGVAVVIDVPGPRSPGLTINDIVLLEQTEEGATFSVLLQNTGNVLIKGEGLLTISAADGAELGAFPLAIDTILPGDLAEFHFTFPITLSAADYLLSLSIRYGNGDYTSAQDIRISVSDTQTEPGADAGNDDAQLTRLAEAGASLNDMLIDWVTANRALATGIFAVLFGLFLFLDVLIWRKWLAGKKRK